MAVGYRERVIIGDWTSISDAAINRDATKRCRCNVRVVTTKLASVYNPDPPGRKTGFG